MLLSAIAMACAAPPGTGSSQSTPPEVVSEPEAIARAVNAFFAEPADVVERDLSPDMIAILPRHAGSPIEGSDGWILPPWHLHVENDLATLSYQPPEMLFAYWRARFVMDVQRVGESWTVTRLGSAMACGLRSRSHAQNDSAQNDPETPR